MNKEVKRAIILIVIILISAYLLKVFFITYSLLKLNEETNGTLAPQSDLGAYLSEQEYGGKRVNVMYVGDGFDLTDNFYENYKLIEGKLYENTDGYYDKRSKDVLKTFTSYNRANSTVYLYEMPRLDLDRFQKELESIIDIAKEKEIDMILLSSHKDLSKEYQEDEVKYKDFIESNQSLEEKIKDSNIPIICMNGCANADNNYVYPLLLSDSIITVGSCDTNCYRYTCNNYKNIDYIVPKYFDKSNIGYFGAIYANMLSLYAKDRIIDEIDKWVIEPYKEQISDYQDLFGKGVISLERLEVSE